MFGIKQYEATGKSLELTGDNGTNKTSIIDSLIYFFENSSERDIVTRKGADESEVFVQFDNGIEGTRKQRPNKATDYISIKQDGKAISSPESFLKSLFTPLQLKPAEFVALNYKEQNRMLLDLIDFKWDLNWIKEQFGELVPGINYEQNVLRVLNDIQSINGHYYKTRQEINSRILHNIKTVTDIGGTLPESYNPLKWEKIKLSEMYTDIEQRRRANRTIEEAKKFCESVDGKIRGFDAEKEIKLAGIEKEISVDRSGTEKHIVKLEEEIRAHKVRLRGLEESRITKRLLAAQDYDNSIAEFKVKIEDSRPLAEKALDQTIPALVEEAETVELMKSHLLEFGRMVTVQEETSQLKAESEAFTVKIEKARSLPGEILETCDLPVECLTIENGEPRINGLPVSNLSSGEAYNLCIDIAVELKEKKDNLNLLLLDGIEQLSPQNRELAYKKCKDKGIRFIATRTTGDKDLTILEL